MNNSPENQQESGSTDNSQEDLSSNSNNIVIDVGPTEGGESPSSSSALPHQNVFSHQQGNMDNWQEIQSSNSDIEVESAGGVGYVAFSSEQVPQRYCREVSPKDRKTCLELYEAAKDGKWEAAKRILDEDRDLVRAYLTNRMETILHVATQANQVDFVRCLLVYLDEHEIRGCLQSKDVNDHTAFLFAVASGNIEIVDMMGQRNPELRITTGHLPHYTPLYVAALHGRSRMARHLYEKTYGFEYGEEGLKILLFLCVNAGIYDLALELIKKEQGNIAFARNSANETILHILSRQTLGLKQTQQHELVRYLWNDIYLKLPEREFLEMIRRPPHVAFHAVKAGDFKFFKMLSSTYPHLIWEVDESARSIIHIGVLNRAVDIFNFMHDIGSIKDMLVQFIDKDANNILHMAATVPSKDQLNLLAFGPAFQMTLELLWFEAVKKIVPPSFIEMKNREGLTPQEVFTMDHEKLADEAQSWKEKTTNCCLVVSTLITTGVFAATFSIPGDIDDKTVSPNYLVEEKSWFMIFSIFDAIALISSSTSIFIFLSILISRHAEFDFQYKALPIKLIFGLITLLISIISMMISFSSAFIMHFNTKRQSHGSHHNGLKWVPIFICVLAFIPIPVFVYMLWPLWREIAKLTKFSWNLSQPMKNMLRSKRSSG